MSGHGAFPTHPRYPRLKLSAHPPRSLAIPPVQSPILITADAIIDARAEGTLGTALLAEPVEAESGGAALRILALGTEAEIASHEAAASADRRSFEGCTITPAFANAHTHLDLTHVGPRPFDPSAQTFVDWVGFIRSSRTDDAEGIGLSVREGIVRSLRGGVIAVGDIAGVGRVEPLEELRSSPLVGVSFIEYFGLGPNQRTSIAAIDELFASSDDHAMGVTRAFQPHAPYSAGIELYQHAARASIGRRLPVSTHLAETRAELDVVSSCGGPFAAFLKAIGALDDETRAAFSRGAHPVEHLRETLAITPFLLAHVNHCPDEFLPLLAGCGATVAYCPRAHIYFGNESELGPHPYRRMLGAGIPVALGTDSVVNLPPEEADRITPLDDARLLHVRDGADARMLLGMITTTPAAALGLDPAGFSIEVGGETRALCAVRTETGDSASPHESVMRSSEPPTLLRPGLG